MQGTSAAKENCRAEANVREGCGCTGSAIEACAPPRLISKPELSMLHAGAAPRSVPVDVYVLLLNEFQHVRPPSWAFEGLYPG